MGCSTASVEASQGYDPIALAAATEKVVVDGNKRTALASTSIFLGLNGLRLTAANEEALSFILGLYETGEFRFEKLEPWLRAHTKQR